MDEKQFLKLIELLPKNPCKASIILSALVLQEKIKEVEVENKPVECGWYNSGRMCYYQRSEYFVKRDGVIPPFSCPCKDFKKK